MDQLLAARLEDFFESACSHVRTGRVDQIRADFECLYSELSASQYDGDMRADMHNNLRVTPSISFVPPDTFEKATHKGKVFIRNYEEKPAESNVAEVLPLKQE